MYRILNTQKDFEKYLNYVTLGKLRGSITILDGDNPKRFENKYLVRHIPIAEFGNLCEGLECLLNKDALQTTTLKIIILSQDGDDAIVLNLKNRLNNIPSRVYKHIWNGFYIEQEFAFIHKLRTEKGHNTAWQKSYLQ